MKRMFAVLIPLALLGACEVPKPWSPSDSASGKSSSNPASENIPAKIGPPPLDIGDAEQGVFVEGKVAKESTTPDLKTEAVADRRKFVQQVTANVSGPATEFWIEYTLRCTRNFKGQPVVVRATVKVNDTPVDKIAAVLGAQAQRNSFSKKVNLLAGATSVPSSLLATVEGELLLMPVGTAEATVNPETAVSGVSSRALQATIIRVNFGPGPAAGSAGPSPAPSL
jgi:hypothetical protein